MTWQNEQSTFNEASEPTPDSGIINTMTSITKRRMQLNMKILGVQLGTSQDSSGGQSGIPGQHVNEKQSFREQFMPPEMSIVGKLMNKVFFQ